MRGLRYAFAAAITASMLGGCSDSGGSGSNNLEDQVTLPDDSDVPEAPIEEEESSGTDGSETGFTSRRFWIEGDQESSLSNAGLKAVPATDNSSVDRVDPDAEPERQLFTIPEIDSSGSEDRLAPAGIFYRRANQFQYAPTPTPNDPANSSRQVSDESTSGVSCIGSLAFDTANTDNTAVSYSLNRDGSGNCPSRFSAGADWKQVLVGSTDTEGPSAFPQDHVPVVGLNATSDGKPAQWLVLDRSGTDPQLVRVAASDLTSTNAVQTDLAGTLDEVHRMARLGPDSFILAYGTPDDDSTPDTDETEYRLAHYNRNDNSLSDLDAQDDLPDSLSRLPLSEWVATSGSQAFIGIGNALLSVDSTSYSLLDSVAGSGRPYFVTASSSHVVWGARSTEDDGNLKQVRVVSQGGSSGGSILVRAPYVESRTRGAANGWIYFTVARGITEKGRLETGFAIGLNPAKSSNNAFILENAQWIGSSVDPTVAAAPQDLATAPINNLFYRAGPDNTMRNVRALEDPTDPIQSVDGGLKLPAVSLGTLPERFTAVFMNEGFGPQRLLTAVEVSDEGLEEGEDEVGTDTPPSLTNRVYFVNPQTPDSLSRVSEQDGSLVRALPLF